MVALPRYDRQMAINNLDHMLVCVCVVRALMYEYEGTHAYRAARRERCTRHGRRGRSKEHGTALVP